jgi:drug/metabolite transporter (DMT)-like permease
MAAAAYVWVWQSYGRQRQDRNIATAIIGLITLFLLLLWSLFLSRLRWRIRLGVFGGVVGLILLVMALFRFHGVTGEIWCRSSSGAGNARPGLRSLSRRSP